MKVDRRTAISSLIASLFAGLLPKVPSDHVPVLLTKGYSLYISPEAMEDIRNWGMNQVDESTRKEIYACNGLTKKFGVGIIRM